MGDLHIELIGSKNFGLKSGPGPDIQVKVLKAKMKECVFFNEIIFFIQYNLPQLEHTYSNDPPVILCKILFHGLDSTKNAYEGQVSEEVIVGGSQINTVGVQTIRTLIRSI